MTLALLLVALLPVLTRTVHWRWELASIAGLVSAVGVLALCGYPVRPREIHPPATLSLNRHRDLGFVVLGLALVHTVSLLVIDPSVWEFAKPTMPWYQAAGWAGLLLLGVLGATSTRRPRRVVWRQHRGFQAFHVVSSVLAVVLITVHVVVSARYAHGVLRASLVLGTTLVALAMLLIARKGAAQQAISQTLIGRSAFGRYSRAVVLATLLGCLAVSVLVSNRVNLTLREPYHVKTQRLLLNFPHEKHTEVNCLTCHHDYADHKGHGTCVQCHRAQTPDLKVGVEARFHTFCFDCHRDPKTAANKHGPVAGCDVCHRSPEAQTTANAFLIPEDG